jgi:hypothetical protein
MGESGPALIATDAVEKGADPLEYLDKELKSRSLQRLRDFVAAFPDVTPIFGREYDPSARSSKTATRGLLAQEGSLSQGRFE